VSLNEQWEKFAIMWCEKANRVPPSRYWRARMREAFYAGAEATLDEVGLSVTAQHEIQAEIDHFKAGKP
jgi:hypothetical protein